MVTIGEWWLILADTRWSWFISTTTTTATPTRKIHADKQKHRPAIVLTSCWEYGRGSDAAVSWSIHVVCRPYPLPPWHVNEQPPICNDGLPIKRGDFSAMLATSCLGNFVRDLLAAWPTKVSDGLLNHLHKQHRNMILMTECLDCKLRCLFSVFAFSSFYLFPRHVRCFLNNSTHEYRRLSLALWPNIPSLPWNNNHALVVYIIITPEHGCYFRGETVYWAIGPEKMM